MSWLQQRRMSRSVKCTVIVLLVANLAVAFFAFVHGRAFRHDVRKITLVYAYTSPDTRRVITDPKEIQIFVEALRLRRLRRVSACDFANSALLDTAEGTFLVGIGVDHIDIRNPAGRRRKYKMPERLRVLADGYFKEMAEDYVRRTLPKPRQQPVGSEGADVRSQHGQDSRAISHSAQAEL